MIAYEQDRGAFPQKMSDVESYAPSRRRASYKCPKIDGRGFGRGYAYNKAFFNGKKLSSISKKDLETHPLLVEVQNPEEDVLSPKSMFAKRHMAGRWANAFYVGRGAIRLHLADEQASRPIVAFQREALPETAP
jgi:hypothetical protein